MTRRMIPMLTLLLVLAMPFASLAARPDVADSRDIVVYQRDLAEVREFRTVNIQEGEHEVMLGMIPLEAIPGSARLEVLKGSVTTRSLSYSDELLDVDAYWQSRVGDMVELVDGEETYRGTLRRVTSEHFYLAPEEGAGELMVLDRSLGGKTLEGLPAGAVTEPSFRWAYTARSNGEATVKLSYMTEAMTWTGQHYAQLENDNDAEVHSRVAVENKSGQSFAYDRLVLVGGNVHLAGDQRRVDRNNPRPGASRGDGSSRFGNLRAWVIEDGFLPMGHTTIRELAVGKADEVGLTYVYDASIFNDRVAQHLTFTFDKALPSGVVRVWDYRGDEDLFMGEDEIDDTPPGSPLDLTLGQVFDITAKRERLEEGSMPDGTTRQVFQVVIGNSSDEEVTVQVLERTFGDWSLESATVDGDPIEGEVKDARTLSFDVDVPLGKTRTLKYEIRYAR